jgi:hypothetical protein
MDCFTGISLYPNPLFLSARYPDTVIASESFVQVSCRIRAARKDMPNKDLSFGMKRSGMKNPSYYEIKSSGFFASLGMISE